MLSIIDTHWLSYSSKFRDFAKSPIYFIKVSISLQIPDGHCMDSWCTTSWLITLLFVHVAFQFQMKLSNPGANVVNINLYSATKQESKTFFL